MAEDPEKKFHSIMDKLFSSSKSSSLSSSMGESSRGKKRPNPEPALALVEPRAMVDILDVSRRSSVAQSNAPLCRPWDRGDLMKRVATFKSMTWFGKPKAVNAVNCARRGWINVDTDIIACEACAARLLFSTPSSWPQQQGKQCPLLMSISIELLVQVEKAALVFSLKLDSGHKLLCPWGDNACDERLAEFPPTPFPVLADKFKERSSKLLQLLALPVVSSSAIEYMRSPQLEEFLSQSSTLDLCNESPSMSEIEFLGNEKEADSANLYYQAQKLISLCGWEPRLLPYVVDCIEKPKGSEILKSSLADSTRNSSSNVCSAATGEREVNEEGGNNIVSSVDPNSIVLDCGLCGASVGLWTYSTVPRPLELFRVAGVVEVNGNRSGGQELENADPVNKDGVLTSSSNSFLFPPTNMKFTIAGGPPPTKQNFKATVSLPVIGRNLRARLSYDKDFGDHSSGSQLDPASQSEKLIMSNMEKDHTEDKAGDNPPQSETLESSKSKENDQRQVSASNSENPSVISPGGCETPEIDNALPQLEESTSVVPNTHSNQSESSTIQNSLISAEKSNSGTGGPQNRANGDVLLSGTVKEFKELSSNRSMDFDPIRQHRHFCPWIVSTNSGAPGWQQTLTALQRQNDRSNSSPKTPSTSSIIKVNDPITSVRRLFRSPSAKRPKLTPGSS
ncbi:unnamed protein product [Linum tenue]|uniref:C3HC-type domain-containing protein n=2 Tax=Linum tenue TaxID=586396 RepID=A0AAV0H752_9ROSI|nr:unnamed protein product [Linum tenue]